MGSSFSTSNHDGSGPTGLGDLPENCLAIILANLDPPDLCNLARTNKAFHRASSADFIWEPKLPENYRTLAEKLLFYEGSPQSCLVKKDIYAGFCSPVRFSNGTKEVWLDKERGGICMLCSWKGMKITGIDDRRYWSHIPTLQSRGCFVLLIILSSFVKADKRAWQTRIFSLFNAVPPYLIIYSSFHTMCGPLLLKEFPAHASRLKGAAISSSRVMRV